MAANANPGANARDEAASGVDADAETVLRVERLSKSYGAVQALDDVSFGLDRNEIMGLVGDNGAGKSTLLKILNGFLSPTSGTIHVDGEAVSFDSPQDARDAGIAMTYQHLALVESAPVWENFFMGKEVATEYGPVRTIRKREMIAETENRLSEYGVELDVEADVRDLSGGEQQIVSISRSIESDPTVLLLDEPLTQLGRTDREVVLEFIETLRATTDVSIVIVSHDLEIVRELVDTIMILRDGRKTLSGPAGDITTDDIIDHMI
jgi:simple sugar transport system ATP-binding protein